MNLNCLKILRQLTLINTMSQREISMICDISLAKTNKLFCFLIEEGFLEVKNRSYILTKKAYEALKEYSVDNAIILADSFTLHFQELFYEEIEGAFEVFFERVLEYKIKQLLEAGIKHITVVTGYLKEKYEYLKEKYGVELIHNQNYIENDTITSFYNIRHLLKNTYIVNADHYLPENIYNVYEFENWSSMIKSKADSQNWYFVTDKKDRIQKVTLDGRYQWAMSGVLFFNNELSEKLKLIIEKEYNSFEKKYFNWQEILNQAVQDINIFANKQNADSVYRFYNINELKEFDKVYKECSNSEIMCMINKAFEGQEDGVKGIKPLKAGMTNKSFIFEFKDKKHMCRICGEGTEDFINREAEFANYQAVTPLNITENVAFMDSKTGDKISEYIDDARALNINDPEELKKAMELAKKIHNSGIVVPHKFDIEEQILLYENLCKPLNAILYEDYIQLKAKMEKLLSILQKIKGEYTFCHVDLNCDNFLVLSNGELKLIDWEYAGMSDPLIDIAMFAIYSYFSQSQLEEIMGYYFEGEPTHNQRLRIYIYAALGGFLWGLWTEYKLALGVAFGDYGTDMYNFSKEYYDKAMELVEENKK